MLVQSALLMLLIIGLDLISIPEILPVLEAHTAFTSLAHFCHVLLDVLERVEHAY